MALMAIFAQLKSCSNYLFEDEYIEKNPFAKVKQIKTDKVIIETFEVEEVKRMLNQFNKKVYTEFRDALLIQILYDTGIRISEGLILKYLNIVTAKKML